MLFYNRRLDSCQNTEPTNTSILKTQPPGPREIFFFFLSSTFPFQIFCYRSTNEEKKKATIRIFPGQVTGDILGLCEIPILTGKIGRKEHKNERINFVYLEGEGQKQYRGGEVGYVDTED